MKTDFPASKPQMCKPIKSNESMIFPMMILELILRDVFHEDKNHQVVFHEDKNRKVVFHEDKNHKVLFHAHLKSTVNEQTIDAI